MLRTQLGEGTVKWCVAAQPFVGYDGESILVAGGPWHTINLFGRHVDDSTHNILRILIQRALRDKRDAKVAEQNVIVAPDQHIFRLDVAVYQSFIMRML